MKKPNKTILALYNLSVIKGIDVNYVQNGVDTSETRVTLIGSNGTLKGRWETYKPYLEVSVDFRSIARLKDRYVKEVDDWKKFERINSTEYDEYLRLRNKFEK